MKINKYSRKRLNANDKKQQNKKTQINGGRGIDIQRERKRVNVTSFASIPNRSVQWTSSKARRTDEIFLFKKENHFSFIV